MRSIWHAVAVVCLVALSTPCFSQVVFSDGFEYTNSFPTNGWVFDPWGDSSSVYTTTAQQHQGLQSVLLDSNDDAEQRLKRSWTGPTTNLRVTAWMYDDGDTDDFKVFAVGMGAVHAYMGVWTDTSASEYSTEANTLASWQATNVSRVSNGWVELKFEVTPAGLKYFINGTEVRSSTHLTEIEWVQLLSGDHNNSEPDLGSVYFDGVEVLDLQGHAVPGSSALGLVALGLLIVGTSVVVSRRGRRTI